MKQAQAMQDNLKRAQDELALIEVTGESGAGLVKVNGTVFKGNSAQASGALNSYRANLVVTNCVFDGNTALATGGLGFGGAIGMNNNDVGDMISKALIKLTTNDPFFGCVAMRLNMEAVDQKFIAVFEEARGYPFTIATDGKAIRYNPEWVAKQQISDLVGVLAHEAAHVALKHNLRRGERDINGWNIACDLAINPHLFDAGYSLPGFDDAKKASCAQYKEMSAEKIYGMIPKLLPPDGGGKGGGGDGNGDDKPDQFNQAPKDPGGVLDHPKSNPKDQNQQRELEEQADGEIEAAYNAAKTQGSVPGWMDRVIKGRRKVLNDYRRHVQCQVHQTVVDIGQGEPVIEFSGNHVPVRNNHDNDVVVGRWITMK